MDSDNRNIEKEWCKFCQQRNDLLSKREEILWYREDVMQAREKQLREEELMFEEKKRTFDLRKVSNAEELKNCIPSSSTRQDFEPKIVQKGPDTDDVEKVDCWIGSKRSFPDVERKMNAQIKLLEEKEKSLLMREENVKILEKVIETKLVELYGLQKNIEEKMNLLMQKERAVNEANEIIVLKEMALHNHEKLLNMKESNILNQLFFFSSNTSQSNEISLETKESLIKQLDEQMKNLQSTSINGNENQSSLEESIFLDFISQEQKILAEVKRDTEIKEMEKNGEKKVYNETLQETDSNKLNVHNEQVIDEEECTPFLKKSDGECAKGSIGLPPRSLNGVYDKRSEATYNSNTSQEEKLDEVFFKHYEESKETMKQNMLTEDEYSNREPAVENCFMIESQLNDNQYREMFAAFVQDIVYNQGQSSQRAENNSGIITSSKTTDVAMFPNSEDIVESHETCDSNYKTESFKIPEILVTENRDFQTSILPQSYFNRIIPETNLITSLENISVETDDYIAGVSCKSSPESLPKPRKEVESEKDENLKHSLHCSFIKTLGNPEPGNIEDVSSPEISTNMGKLSKAKILHKNVNIDIPADFNHFGLIKLDADDTGKQIESMGSDENDHNNLQLQIQDDRLIARESSSGSQKGESKFLETSAEIVNKFFKSYEFNSKNVDTPLNESSDSIHSRCSSVMSSVSSSNSVQGSANELNKKSRKRPPRDALLKAITSNQYLEIVKLVESRDIVLEQLDGSGCTAFLLGVAKGNVDLVQRLRSRGSNIWACDYDGNSALHIAVTNNDIEMVELLLKMGLNPNLTNNDGKTAIRLASDLKHLHLRKCLEKFVKS